jgi:hypothetical protein
MGTTMRRPYEEAAHVKVCHQMVMSGIMSHYYARCHQNMMCEHVLWQHCRLQKKYMAPTSKLVFSVETRRFSVLSENSPP